MYRLSFTHKYVENEHRKMGFKLLAFIRKTKSLNINIIGKFTVYREAFVTLCVLYNVSISSIFF